MIGLFTNSVGGTKMTDSELTDLAARLGEALKQRKMLLATAESCTGGWIGQVITSVPGSSHWYDRGFITYTNTAKREMLGVKTDTLARFGAVSEQTVRAMAEGALANSQARIALAVSGIAGPGGGSEGKPVGQVCLAWAREGADTVSERQQFSGDREAVRRQAVVRALEGLLAQLNGDD